jgi:predicted PurR-regulated permease PerM
MIKTKVETTLGVIWAFFVRLCLLALIGYTLYRVRSILVAVMLAIMLTYVVLPVVEFLCSFRVRGWPARSQRFWATVLVFIMLLAVSGITIRYIVAPFADEAKSLYDTVAGPKGLDSLSTKASGWYTALPDDVKTLFGAEDKETVKTVVLNWLKKVLATTVAWVGHALDIILIPVLAFYFAVDSRSLRREFIGALPKSRRREALSLLRRTGAILQNYAVGQLILCVIAGVVVGLMLWGLSLNYVLALAVFAGVTRAIPVVGPIISGIAIVVIGFLKAPIIGLYLLGIFTAMHFAESKFLLPKLIGYQMRLHPAVIIIVLLIGAEFFGILGMFLAAPVAAILRELIRFYVIAPRARNEKDSESLTMLPACSE